MSSAPLTIGLFGFGVVGEGIYKVLRETPSLHATIKKICIRHPGKERNADIDLFTTDYEELLGDPEINLIVELIDDATEAHKIITTALRKRKAVVSANKKMIAEHLNELLSLQQEYQTPFLYEAAVCGSIPILRNLEEYYDNDLLQSICGIVNGSTNFILSRMASENISYERALSLAQQAGFAETNPLLDVEGHDAASKLSILLAHAYGISTHPGKIMYGGITQLHTEDAKFAAEKNYVIKLAAQARKLNNGKIAAFVLPQFVTRESQLYYVQDEFNGVILETKLADKQFLYGKGAGRYPTSSAVISDISALRYQYKYEYKKLNAFNKPVLATDYYLKVYVSFNNWEKINKWDFESIDAYHSTCQRQYIIGLIHVEKLQRASWFGQQDTSIIVLPSGIVEKDIIVLKSLKKVSLQLGGLYE